MKFAVFNENRTLRTCLIEGVHDIPGDAVGINEEQFFKITQEVDGIWTLDGSGKIVKEPLINNVLDQASAERAWRDAQMIMTEWLMTRHRDEQDMQRATTLIAKQFSELLAYRQGLRDWPQTEAFPDSMQRPVAPPWIAEQAL